MSLAIVEAVFAADACRLDAWRSILHPKVHARIGNRKPVIGLAAVLTELEVVLSRVSAFGGSYREVWELPDATLVETEVVAHSADGRVGSIVPCALFFRTGGGALALDLRFYLDPRPLFEASKTDGRADSSRHQ